MADLTPKNYVEAQSTYQGRREAMRKTLGVVKYVEVAETDAAPAEAGGSS